MPQHLFIFQVKNVFIQRLVFFLSFIQIYDYRKVLMETNLLKKIVSIITFQKISEIYRTYKWDLFALLLAFDWPFFLI